MQTSEMGIAISLSEVMVLTLYLTTLAFSMWVIDRCMGSYVADRYTFIQPVNIDNDDDDDSVPDPNQEGEDGKEEEEEDAPLPEGEEEGEEHTD